MKMNVKAVLVTAIICVLGACASVQTTSGADYLARYNDAGLDASARSTLDEEVRAIAAIEPNIQFPARIGLARVHNGRLTGVPAEEGYLWEALSEEVAQLDSELVPVSPLVAATVAPALAPNGPALNRTAGVLGEIRRGAARQHLDYVLVYETSTAGKSRKNALNIGNLTVLGLFVLPSRNLQVDVTASGLFMDVRNGYPYITATGFAAAEGVTTQVRKRQKREALLAGASLDAIGDLAGQMAAGLHQLSHAQSASTEPSLPG